MAYTVTLSVPNISCHHCTMTIQRETKELPGVIEVNADVEAKTATYTLQSEETLKPSRRPWPRSGIRLQGDRANKPGPGMLWLRNITSRCRLPA